MQIYYAVLFAVHAAAKLHHCDARDKRCSCSNATYSKQPWSHVRQCPKARWALFVRWHDQVCVELQGGHVAASLNQGQVCRSAWFTV